MNCREFQLLYERKWKAKILLQKNMPLEHIGSFFFSFKDNPLKADSLTTWGIWFPAHICRNFLQIVRVVESTFLLLRTTLSWYTLIRYVIAKVPDFQNMGHDLTLSALSWVLSLGFGANNQVGSNQLEEPAQRAPNQLWVQCVLKEVVCVREGILLCSWDSPQYGPQIKDS